MYAPVRTRSAGAVRREQLSDEVAALTDGGHSWVDAAGDVVSLHAGFGLRSAAYAADGTWEVLWDRAARYGADDVLWRTDDLPRSPAGSDSRPPCSVLTTTVAPFP